MKIPCPKCKGSGVATLTKKLAAALEQVPKLPRFANATGVAAALAINTTTANMRLEKLRTMKLLTRTRDGVGWMYSRPRVSPEWDELHALQRNVRAAHSRDGNPRDRDGGGC